MVRWAAGIAAVAAVVMLVLMIKSSAPVATVAQADGAVWSSAKLAVGARLKPGWLRLEKGAVVIAFDRGARVVLEGPADFEVRGDNSAALRAGRLRAHVPTSAHGFKVETPQFMAVDLGTEFGCDLGLNGVGELHVFTGKVDLLANVGRSAAVELGANQAMRINGGVTGRIAPQPLSFLSENELARRKLRAKGDSLGAWRMAGRQLDENPATVLHFDFEDVADAVITNRALQAPGGSHARIFGCAPTEGRWPGKRGLAFQGEGDRLEFALPGQFESLTLLAWVRVNRLHAGANNPLVTGHGSGAGEMQWFIYHDGGLGLEIRNTQSADPGRTFLHTRPVIEGQNLGSWVFMACVLDGATGAATHYLNGERVGARFEFVHVPFQLNAAEVGNSLARESRQPGDPPPNFDGSIDELAVISSALTPNEIALLYRQGKPSPH